MCRQSLKTRAKIYKPADLDLIKVFYKGTIHIDVLQSKKKNQTNFAISIKLKKQESKSRIIAPLNMFRDSDFNLKLN